MHGDLDVVKTDTKWHWARGEWQKKENRIKIRWEKTNNNGSGNLNIICMDERKNGVTVYSLLVCIELRGSIEKMCVQSMVN